MERAIIEDTPQFNEQSLKNLISSVPIYHPDEDTFFIHPENPSPAVSYDWEGEIWIRFDPKTKEVVGLEIENFESIFIKKHPEVAKIWKEIKSLCIHKKTKAIDENLYESFIRILLNFFTELFKSNPQQVSFGIA